MNWNHELIASSLWLLEAFAITTMVSFFCCWALIRFTHWGKQFWRLSGEYFSPKRNWRPLVGLLVILFFTLGAVRINVLFSYWYNEMYTALQKFDQKAFWFSMLLFSILASIHIARALVNYLISQSFTIYWRKWLNENLLSSFIDKQAFYRIQYLDIPSDNPDQRIQQDIADFVTNSLGLSMGVIGAFVSIIEFTIILWGLSGTLAIFGMEIPRSMVFCAYIYVLIATVFAFKIGRPLIRLDFLSQLFNADYRYALIRLREYGESIAFYRGEAVEGRNLRQRFSNIIQNAWAMVFRSLKFQGFNLVISQTAAVFPIILQASRFFAKKITLGDLVQTAQAFGQLLDSLSFFRLTYDSFASFKATLDRLTGFMDSVEQANALPSPNISEAGDQLNLCALNVKTPSGQVLISQLNISIEPNQPLLIRGRSGSGKTTLLRALAGLWPYCEGQITRPIGQALFLSQKAYLPLGNLRDALYYPASAESNGEAEEVLAAVQLEHLIPRLDQTSDWSHILSQGEQQRLAFGRLLLAKPPAAFLDEATSAMDEGMEHAMYSLIRKRLPNIVLVSVGHRSTLNIHHPQQLELIGDGAWQILTTA